MIRIDLQSRTPLYDQIVASVVRLCVAGALRPGDPLPSVRSLAMTLGINPNTVQRAYMLLEQKGVTVSVAGRGSFIAQDSRATAEWKQQAELALRQALTAARDAGLSAAECRAVLCDIMGGGGE